MKAKYSRRQELMSRCHFRGSFGVKTLLRGLTLLTWILALSWYFQDRGYESLIAAISGLSTLVASLSIQNKEDSLPDRNSQGDRLSSRKAFIQLVKSYWIKDVLENSLEGGVMLDLRMIEASDLVKQPVLFSAHPSRHGNADSQTREIPLGECLVDGNTLLIVGDLGSGKTTLLLQLARSLLAGAENDPSRPVPVLVDLTPWGNGRHPMDKWLPDELNRVYGVPYHISRSWLQQGELALLLDGLDQVEKKYVGECIEAINEYRKEYGLTTMVVTCRHQDYLNSQTLLNMHNAVIVQSLTVDQVSDFLTSHGIAQGLIDDLLQSNRVVAELAQSPLMVNLIAQTLSATGSVSHSRGATAEECRFRIVDRCVEGMLDRNLSGIAYSREEVLARLRWLANKLRQNRQTSFRLEFLQPSWLDTMADSRLYGLLSRLLTGLAIGLLCGLLSIIPIVLLTTGKYQAGSVLLITTLACLILGLLGMLSGAIIGIVRGHKVKDERIRVIEGVTLSSSIVRTEVTRRSGVWLRSLQTPGQLNDFGLMLYMLGLHLVSAVPSGLQSVLLDEKIGGEKGLLQSAKIGLFTGFLGQVYGLVAIVLLVVMYQIVGFLSSVAAAAAIGAPALPLLGDQLLPAIIIAIPAGMILGALGFLRYGGLASVQNIALRQVMYVRGYLPWRPTRFFDDVWRIGLVRKGGGGYTFAHEIFLDYFATSASHVSEDGRSDADNMSAA